MKISDSCTPAPSQKRGRKKTKLSSSIGGGGGSGNQLDDQYSTSPTTTSATTTNASGQPLSFEHLLGEIMHDTEHHHLYQQQLQQQQQQQTTSDDVSAPSASSSSVTSMMMIEDASATLNLPPSVVALSNSGSTSSSNKTISSNSSSSMIDTPQSIMDNGFWYTPDQVSSFNQSSPVIDSSSLMLTTTTDQSAPPRTAQHIQKLNEAVNHLQRENQLLKEQLQKKPTGNSVLDVLADQNDPDVGMIVTVKPGKIVSCNPFILNKLGYDSTFFDQNRYWHEVVHPLYWDVIVTKIQDAFQNRLSGFTVENVMVKKKEQDQFLLAKKAVMSFFFDQQQSGMPLFGVCRIYF